VASEGDAERRAIRAGALRCELVINPRSPRALGAADTLFGADEVIE
jgi:hypothetical protein